MRSKKQQRKSARASKKTNFLKFLLMIIKIVFSLGFLWFFLHKGFSFAPFLYALSSFKPLPAVLALLMIFLKDYLLFTLIFLKLLTAFGSRASFRDIFIACAAETSLAFVMPVKSATLLRYYLFLPRSETAYGIPSFFLIEQLCIVFALLGLSAIGLYLSFSREIGLLLFCLLLLCLFIPHLLIKTRASRLIKKNHFLSKVFFIILEFMTRPHFYQILALFFLYFSLATTGFYLCTYSLNAQVSLPDCFLFFPLILFVTKLPITISGIGIRELSVQFFFQKLAAEKVLGVSLMHFILEYTLPSLFGLLFLPKYFKLLEQKTLYAKIPGKKHYTLLDQ